MSLGGWEGTAGGGEESMKSLHYYPFELLDAITQTCHASISAPNLRSESTPEVRTAGLDSVGEYQCKVERSAGDH